MLMRRRRSSRRYPVRGEYPLKAWLLLQSTAPQDAHAGWRRWGGIVQEVSAQGLSLRLAPGAMDTRRGITELRLEIDGLVFQLPCEIRNMRQYHGYARCGVQLVPRNHESQRGYLQLLECLRLGATLVPRRHLHLPNPELKSEFYLGEKGEQLYVWRKRRTGFVHSFELHFAGHILRGEGTDLVQLNGRPKPSAPVSVYSLPGSAEPRGKPAVSNPRYRRSPGEHIELQRSFRWAVLNLSPKMPYDVHYLMSRFAAPRHQPANELAGIVHEALTHLALQAPAQERRQAVR